MQVDRDEGSVWVMIHCGSRGYGWQTANHYFYAGAELRGLPKNRREQSWLRVDEPMGREYWAHHNSAANYAVANRHVIVRGVQQALEDVFFATGEVFYEISHNLVQQETLVLPDGSTKRGFVHRKGATRAFPPGHPEVPQRYQAIGQPVLVPGDMGRYSFVLIGGEGAMRLAFGSTCHGAGRQMSRTQAVRETVGRDLVAELREAGVVVRHEGRDTLREETSEAYKDVAEVVRVCEGAGLAKPVAKLVPFVVVKG